MRVLVCGGRNYQNKAFIYNILDLYRNRITTIVHGGARGADSIGGQWAIDNNKNVEVFPADWDTHGKAAGSLRNIQMAESRPDIIVAFPGGSGTKHMVKTAALYKIPVADYREEL